jgi:hypothetical protein
MDPVGLHPPLFKLKKTHKKEMKRASKKLLEPTTIGHTPKHPRSHSEGFPPAVLQFSNTPNV